LRRKSLDNQGLLVRFDARPKPAGEPVGLSRDGARFKLQKRLGPNGVWVVRLTPP